MNIADPRSIKAIAVAPAPKLGVGADDISEIKVYTEITDIAAIWTEFETSAIHTVFQTCNWLSAWQKHVGSKSATVPQIVVGFASDRTVQFILPLAIKRRGIVRILSFLGCEEASYQFGLFAPQFLKTLTPECIEKLSQGIARALPAFDIVRFKRQPFDWQGHGNPMAKFSHHPSPSNGFAITLNADYEKLYAATRSWKSRSKILRREQKIAGSGELEYKRCAGRTESFRVLDIMFAQKEKRFCEMGVANFLTRPGVQDFYRCLGDGDSGSSLLELLYFKCGNKVLAVIMGAPYRGRVFGLINSMTDGPLRHYSPGIHTLHHDIEQFCNRGFDVYDLGVGENSYKDQWADQEIGLFDTIIPTSFAGHIYAAGSQLMLWCKHRIKHSRPLWAVYLRCRSKLSLFKKSGGCKPVDETI